MPIDQSPLLSRATVDPASHRRVDDEWLAQAWAAPDTRVLVLGSAARSTSERTDPTRRTRALVTTEGTHRLVLTSPDRAPDGERYLLGTENGRAYFAVRSPEPLRPHRAAEPVSLREVGALLDERDTGLFTRAIALANWNATHGFCPRCGAGTRMTAAGHVRVCEKEGTEQYPRTDPVVIMLVHREREGRDEALLGHNPRWAPRRFSVLAGFVEAGESLEQAVAREAAEEAGVLVTDPRYLSSQPWPFPRSLMAGYTARAVGETEPTDDEITVTRWFTREELSRATHTGEVQLPGRVSIARTLIEHWYGDRLPGGW